MQNGWLESFQVAENSPAPNYFGVNGVSHMMDTSGARTTNFVTLAGEDASSFTLVSNATFIKLLPDLDFETKNLYKLEIRFHDTNGNYIWQNVEVSVTDVSEPTPLPTYGPTNLSASPITSTDICVSGSSQDGTWALTGTHNSKDYWYTSASGGRYIFWDSGNSYWAFATSLGGSAGDNDNGGEYPWSGTWNTISVNQGSC